MSYLWWVSKWIWQPKDFATLAEMLFIESLSFSMMLVDAETILLLCLPKKELTTKWLSTWHIGIHFNPCLSRWFSQPRIPLCDFPKCQTYATSRHELSQRNLFLDSLPERWIIVLDPFILLSLWTNKLVIRVTIHQINLRRPTTCCFSNRFFKRPKPSSILRLKW